MGFYELNKPVRGSEHHGWGPVRYVAIEDGSRTTLNDTINELFLDKPDLYVIALSPMQSTVGPAHNPGGPGVMRYSVTVIFQQRYLPEDD